MAALPEEPQSFVDTSYHPPSGRTINVRRGDEFQKALDAARPGDVITLEAGATFTGPFVLPVKPGSEWIIVRSSADGNSLSEPGTRVDPSSADGMPKLVSSSGPILTTKAGAHHYRFIGIEFHPARGNGSATLNAMRSLIRGEHKNRDSSGNGTFLYSLVTLGSDASSVEGLPHHIIFDRCYLHGDPDVGTRRGIVMNSRHVAVIDSYLSDFKENGADSQAIAGWNGPGPFKIVNNYLEAAGENVMFGGADPAIPDLVPSDIEIRRNHFSKPLSWRLGHPEYNGTPWTVKNLFELKNARRVLVDGNLFEYNWPHAQNGFAILFTVRNQDGSAPWSVVEDVTFTNNVLRHVAAGINILGQDNIHPSRQTRRILIKNNLFVDIGGTWGGGRLFQLLDGTGDITIEDNTALQSDSIVLGGDGKSHRGFVFQNNIAPHNAYGIIGSGSGPGMSSIERYFPQATMRNNVIIGGSANRYPAGNFFPGSLEDVGFMDHSGADYRLEDSSPYVRDRAANKAIGVDFGVLCAAIPETAVQSVSSCPDSHD